MLWMIESTLVKFYFQYIDLQDGLSCKSMYCSEKSLYTITITQF